MGNKQKKREVDPSLPFNKFIDNTSTGLTVPKMANLTDISVWTFYGLKVGRRATLFTALLVQYLTKGEIKPEDLLTKEALIEFEEVKKKVEAKILVEKIVSKKMLKEKILQEVRKKIA